MRSCLPHLLPLLCLATAPALAADDAPAVPDLSALVQCQAPLEAYADLIVPVEDPLAAVALGWAPQARSNPFLAEYRLNTPVAAFGRHSDHLAISGGTVMLVFDAAEVPPQALASELELEVVVDADGKFMAGREVRSVDVSAADGRTLIESAVLGASTVTSHPGRLLVGCTYSLDEPEDGSGAADAEAGTPAAAAG